MVKKSERVSESLELTLSMIVRARNKTQVIHLQEQEVFEMFQGKLKTGKRHQESQAAVRLCCCFT